MSRSLFALALLLARILSASPKVLAVDVNGVVHPVTVEIVSRAIHQAQQSNADAILLRLNTPGGLMNAMRETIELIRADGPDGLWRMMRPKLFHDDASADEGLLYRDADGLVGAVEAIRDREDSTEVARSFSGPVRFVIGEHDPFVSASELGGFDVVELSGAGHLANIERPAEFNELLSEFLQRV